MQRLYTAYSDNEKVEIILVYLREIHPSEQTERARPALRRLAAPRIAQHKTLEERVTAAAECLKGLELTLPTLIDSMDNKAGTAFRVHAAATAVIDFEGRLAYYTTGPKGSQPQEADRVIRELLENDGRMAE